MRWAAGTVMAAALAAQGQAAEPCAPGMICASVPQTLIAALQAEGYKALLEKDKSGDPSIASSASGYNFDIYFYGCEKNLNCSSVQFVASFEAADHYTPKFANAWNENKRFIQMSVNDKKELYLRYDVTTVGGMNAKNFADAVDWWAVMLGDFDNFTKANKPKA